MAGISREANTITRSRLGLRHKLIVWVDALIDGPTHNGGVLPGGAIEPGIARIASRMKAQLESLAASWRHQQYSTPVAIEQTTIEMDTAKADLNARESVLEAYLAEYKRTHRGLEPPAPRTRSRQVGLSILAGLFTLFEVPLTGAAFERLLATDWERLIATVGAAAIIICLSHQIGIWFAKPAKTIGQRLFGWLLVMTLAVILATLSIVRIDAIKQRLRELPKSTPEVRIALPEEGRSLHV